MKKDTDSYAARPWRSNSYSRRRAWLVAGLALLALLIVATYRPVPASADGAASTASSLQSSPSSASPAPRVQPSDGVLVKCNPYVEGEELPQSSR
jgi:hypothetical protein